MALCADLILASEGAKIGDAHSNFGLFPACGAAAILPRVLTKSVAKYLLLTGRTIGAMELKLHGLVNETHPSEALWDETQRLCEDLSRKSPIGLQRMKSVAERSQDVGLESALWHEQVVLSNHKKSYDMKEGVNSFLEKREPKFRGC